MMQAGNAETGKGLEINVDFYGLTTLQAALRKVAPDLDKELKKRTREPVAKAYNRARRMVPTADIPSGWKRRSNGPQGWGDPNRRGWDNRKVRDGIKLKVGKRSATGVTSLWRIINESAAGSIYEFAKVAKTPQGVSFVRAVSRQPTSRLIWRAWDEEGGNNAVLPAIKEAIFDVEKQFNERASKVSGGDKHAIS